MEESNFEKKNNNENVCDNVNSSNVKPDTKIKFKFNEWFEILTGMEEDEFRKLDYPVFSKNEDGTLSLQTKKGGKYNCGEFTIYQLGELRRAFYKKMSELSVGNQKAAKERKQEEKNAKLNPNANNGSNEEFVPIELLTRGDSNSRYVDVSFLQALPENREGVFQVASNFNGVESVSESIAPDTKFFTQHYC